MPVPTQVYATDRSGLVLVLNPSTLALAAAPWSSNIFRPDTGPALFGLGFDNSSTNLYTVGVPDGTTSYFSALRPVTDGLGNYSLVSPTPAGTAFPSTTSTFSFQPESIAIDSANKRVFVADSTRWLTAWSTNLPNASSTFTQLTGSPYYPNNGPIRAQGVAYDAFHNRVFTTCQNSAGQDQLAVYDASVSPMVHIAGSPFSLTLSLNTSRTAIAYDAVNDRVLITTSAGLVVWNAATKAVVAGSPFSTGGLDPRAIALDATNSRVYICNFGSDTLAALNSTGYGPITGSPYPTGHGPKSVAYLPSTNRVYVANFNGNPGGITVYNASTTPLGTVAGSPFQSSFSFNNLAVGP
jgi:DNA-binding beta-propeller fold protein YncE